MSNIATELWRSWLQDDPDAHMTSQAAIYEAAKAYLAAGLSVMPIAADGTKQPDSRRLARWKVYTQQRPTPATLYDWFQFGGPCGMAVIGGSISGGQGGYGLEIIDFDTADLFEPWAELVEQVVPGLWQRLVRVQSPRPGVHVYYRCSEYGGSTKLACTGEVDGNGRQTRKTLIELKGEGGYCLVPPSPKTCHPSHRLYRLAEGSLPLTAIPVITPDERSVLLEQARSFNAWVEAPRVARSVVAPATDNQGLPGEDFNERGSWEDILEPHGWKLVGDRGQVQDWCRPGKDSGISATTNYEGSGVLYVFSSNAYPFEEGQSYRKFRAYALLNHGGDFTGAARALRRKGYGGGASTEHARRQVSTKVYVF